MKKFIFRFTFFLLIGLFIYSAFFFFFKLNFEKKISNSKTVVLGDSHTMHLKFPDSFNYSFYGFPYIVHYNFLKEFEKEIKNKKVVFIFSPNNISKEFQNRFDNKKLRPGWLKMVNENLNGFNVLPEFHYSKYDWYNPFSGKFSKNNFEKLIIKKYSNTSRIERDTLLFAKKILEHYTNPLYLNKDNIQLEYFKKCINLLKKNNCKVLLINTPKTKYYTEHIPDNIMIKYRKILDSLQLEYLDLNTLLSHKLDPSCFMDADHTNNKGDKIINEYLAGQLN